MLPPGRAVLVLLAAAASPSAAAVRVVTSASPVRRVITMLQMMQQRVTTEGMKEEKLFDKYMCYCDTSEAALQQNIARAEAHLPDLESNIKEQMAEKERLAADVQQERQDLTEAEEGLRQSQTIAAQEHQAAVTEMSDLQNNIRALEGAIQALEGGTTGTFLQTSAAGTLRQLSLSLDMSTSDRDMISSFLSQAQSQGYEPKGSEVLGILKQMHEEMQARLAEVHQTDVENQNQTAAMEQARTDQIRALQNQIETQTSRLGELAVDIVNDEADQDDTTNALAQDKRFLADLQTGCNNKKEEWTARQKTRSQELQAIGETIKVLNDDEAMTLFRKTLPTPSFIQLRSSQRKNVRRKALQALEAARRAGKGGKHGARLEMMAMALRAKQASFFKVIKMIDDMIALLNEEQAEDDRKKDYCRTELDQSSDQTRAINLDISDLGKAIEEEKQKAAAITEEVTVLSANIRQLDRQVEESTAQRKEEHAEYVEKLSTNTATKELLDTAKRILSRFYSSDAAAGTSQAEAESQESEPAPFFAQLGSQRTAGKQPAPPPETWNGRYEKQHSGSLGVLGMIAQLTSDLGQDSAQVEADERSAQIQYEESIADAAAKRANDARVISEKETVKAELEARLHHMKQEEMSKRKESKSLREYAADLHNECDWLLANFDLRKEARAGEVESLRQGKAVLSGADYGSEPQPQPVYGSEPQPSPA